MKKLMAKNSLALIVSAAVLAGCSSMDAQDVPEDSSSQNQQSQQQDSQGQTFGSQNDRGVSSTALSEAEAAKKAEQERIAREMEAKAREQAALREIRTFYFDFDKSDIKQDALLALTAHATFLAANSSIKVVLEGHADERGTKEYNMALGERRAKSVERFLVVNGVAPSQIETISYGEEKPAVMGSGETSWAKNRRVFVNYK